MPKQHDDKRLYIAYGSNLKVKDMLRRCPSAEKVGTITLKDCRLVFRGCADIAWEVGCSAYAGLWEITEEDERELDRYEGVGSGVYTKFRIKLKKPRRGKNWAVIYLMTDREGIYPPSAFYASTIADGYRNFELPLRALHEAIEHSFEYKNPSEQTQKRRSRQRQSTHQNQLVKIPLRIWLARQEAENKLAAEREVVVEREQEDNREEDRVEHEPQLPLQ